MFSSIGFCITSFTSTRSTSWKCQPSTKEPMTTTHLMGSVHGKDQKPAELDATTVETTATQSSTLSVDIPLETARLSRPEVASKLVIMQQPSVLAPYTHIWTDKGSLPLLSVDSPNMPDLGSSAAFPHLLHPENRNRNLDDVIPNSYQMSAEA